MEPPPTVTPNASLFSLSEREVVWKRPKLTAGCCVPQAAGTVDVEAGDFIRTLMGKTIITAKTIKMPDEKQLRSWTAARQREFWVCRRNFWGKQRLHHCQVRFNPILIRF